jgi:hypothetical protein
MKVETVTEHMLFSTVRLEAEKSTGTASGIERVRRTRKPLYKVFSSTAVAAIKVTTVAVNWMK